jgi:hypothetical protein
VSDKQELIRQMLEMQRHFIAYEHDHGLDPKDYYVPDENHPLHEYRQKYRDLAMQLVDIAHQEKGSQR